MMRPLILTLITFSTLVACGQANKTERQGEPDIYNVESNDPEMNRAIETSRKTFDNFITALTRKGETYSSFSVKMPFATATGQEHIWLVDVTLKSGKIFGQVGNEPDNVTSIKSGDWVEIDRNKLSDWFYIEGDRLIGGLTIRVLRDRMIPTEKIQFEAEFGVKFD